MDANRHHKLTVTAATMLAILGAAMCVSTATFGATRQPSGAIQLLVTPSLTGHGGKILITGAIGDYGRTFKADSGGNPDPHGSYSDAQLRKGTILFNTGALMKQIAVGTEHGRVNLATCSLEGSATADIAIVSGTGLYSGIAGTVHARFTLGELGATYTSGPKQGRCNQSADPVAQWAAIVGAGTVS